MAKRIGRALLAAAMGVAASAGVVAALVGAVAWAADITAQARGQTAPATASASAPAASPLYTEIVAAYMDGRWDTLEKTLKDRSQELLALPRQEANGVTLIRTALLEGRPDWWAKTKTGGTAPIRVSLWGRTVPMTYDSRTSGGAEAKVVKGKLVLNVGWMPGDMDSTAPAGNGFTRGDLASFTIFSNLGNVESAGPLPPPGRETVIPLERYLEFRAKLTAMAYGTPGARRYGMWQCLASYDERAHGQLKMAPRAVAAMFLQCVLMHPEDYPSIQLPRTAGTGNDEQDLCLAMAGMVRDHPWSFAEDCAVRQDVRELGAANGGLTYASANVILPNKLTISLNQRVDGPLLEARNKWIREQMGKAAKPGKAAGDAVKAP